MEQGDPLDIELIVTDVDGKAVADRPIKVRAVRLAWEFVDGEWKEVEKDEQICDVTSQEEPVKCSFTTGAGGEYRISAKCATTTSGLTAANLRCERWATVPQRNVQMETAVLVPDKRRVSARRHGQGAGAGAVRACRRAADHCARWNHLDRAV